MTDDTPRAASALEWRDDTLQASFPPIETGPEPAPAALSETEIMASRLFPLGRLRTGPAAADGEPPDDQIQDADIPGRGVVGAGRPIPTGRSRVPGSGAGNQGKTNSNRVRGIPDLQ